MNPNQRSIVRCKTEDALKLLMTAVSSVCDDSWSEACGLFRWDDYHEATSVLVVGQRPSGYAPESYYSKHTKQYGDCRWFCDVDTFIKEMIPTFTIKKEGTSMNEKWPDFSHYLAAIAQSDIAPRMSPLDYIQHIPFANLIELEREEKTEAANIPAFGRIEVYRYAVIDNGKAIVEVDETDFQDNAQMKSAKNVQHFVRTTITMGGDIQASATCEASMYDERQGILEAMANLVCQQFCDVSFEKFYNRMLKEKVAYERTLRKCPLCGTVYDTPEQVIKCLEQHDANRKARNERRHWRKLAMKELKQEAMRKRVAEEKARILEEARKDQELNRTAKSNTEN